MLDPSRFVAYLNPVGVHFTLNQNTTIGRFLNRDPLGMIDGPAVYAFCGGDPVNHTDAMGTFWRFYRDENVAKKENPGSFVRTINGVFGVWIPEAGVADPEIQGFTAEIAANGKTGLANNPNSTHYDGPAYNQRAEAAAFLARCENDRLENALALERQQLGVAALHLGSAVAENRIKEGAVTVAIEAPQWAAGGVTKIPGLIGRGAQIYVGLSSAHSVLAGTDDLVEHGFSVGSSFQVLSGVVGLHGVLKDADIYVGKSINMGLGDIRVGEAARIANQAKEALRREQQILNLWKQARGFQSFRALKEFLGAAPAGFAWHHIVGQNAENLERFGAEFIHNTANIILIPHGADSIHLSQIEAYYNSIRPQITGSTILRVRDWLKTQSFEFQYNFGLEALRNNGIKVP